MQLFQPRNPMDSNLKDQAQMLLLMNQARNLENQVGQMREPRGNAMEVDIGNANSAATMQLLLNQMKSFQTQTGDLKSGQQMNCYECGQPGHLARECKNKGKQTSGQQMSCYECGMVGHIARECKNKGKQTGGQQMTCYECGMVGHIARECTNKGKQANGQQMNCYECGMVGHIARDCTNKGKQASGQQMNCYECGMLGHIARDCKNKGRQAFNPIRGQVQPLSNLGAGMDLSGMLAAQLLGMNGEKPSTCVWVTGISKECADPDFLCNIFGNYGNVRRIKFSKKKPDGALIEMSDARHVPKALRFLNDVKLGGERISVKRTKITKVFVSEDDENSKDYSKAIKEHWRYSKDSKFTKIVMKRLSHPTPFVLVSNVPMGKVSALKNYIIESGYTVKGIEEGQPRKEEDKKPVSDSTFVIVELASTEEALSAVGKLHNTMPSNIGEKKTHQGRFNRGLVFTFAVKKDPKETA